MPAPLREPEDNSAFSLLRRSRLARLFGIQPVGRTRFVALDGNDRSAGTEQRPWATLERACAAARPGDYVIVRGGTYRLRAPLRPRRAGTADAWIVYAAAAGERVVLDASGIAANAPEGEAWRLRYTGAFHLEDVSFVRVENLEVAGGCGTGFLVRGRRTHDVDIVACRTDGTYGSGIAVWHAGRVRIVACEIARANDPSLDPAGKAELEPPHEAITVAGARDFIIARNHVHHGFKEGIDCKETCVRGRVEHNRVHDMARQGIYVDAWFGTLEQVEVQSNLVTDCEWGIALGAEGDGAALRDVRVHHNLIFRNRGSGVFFTPWGSDQIRAGIQICHNTIVRNGSETHWAGATGGIDLRSLNVANVSVVHNIVWDNAGFEIAALGDARTQADRLRGRDITIARNLCGEHKPAGRGSRDYAPVYGCVGHETVTGDPAFLDAAAGDFRLGPASAALAGAMPHHACTMSTDLGAFSASAPEACPPLPLGSAGAGSHGGASASNGEGTATGADGRLTDRE